MAVEEISQCDAPAWGLVAASLQCVVDVMRSEGVDPDGAAKDSELFDEAVRWVFDDISRHEFVAACRRFAQLCAVPATKTN